jgi:UDP-N-acetylmuramyl pentapeptide synthase
MMPTSAAVMDFIDGDLKRALKRLYHPPLIEIARWWRGQLAHPCFIGVTGSAGKTTTKDLLGATLAQCFRSVSSSDSNNELYAIARTLLTVSPRTQFCVQELGLDQPNDFIPMLALLRPQVGVVTNIGKDHLKSFRSLGAIAAEKGRLIEQLPASGLAVLNADDPHVIAMAQRTEARVVTFGLAAAADYRAEILETRWPARLSLNISHGAESARINTRLYGAHHAVNVLAAVAAANALGAPFGDAIKAIGAYEPMLGRLSLHPTQRGVTFVRDDWKAPVWSLDCVWEFMRDACASRKIAVIGTLSDYSGNSRPTYRRAVGAALASADFVLLVGEQGPPRAARWQELKPGCLHGFATVRAAADWLDTFAQSGDLVLLKGSGADHLARIALSMDQSVGCWRQRCSRQIFCDHCGLLRRPSTT